MKQVLAIARLAFKAALKSRLLATLAIFLLVVVIGISSSIKGDSTLRGQIVLLLYYTLGLTTITLGVSTIWMSCWSIAREVEEKSIQMLVVKPVYRFQIWLGKWLGILFMNAILLASSAVITMAAVELKMAASDETPEEIAIVREEVLNCRIRLRPNRDAVDAEAHALMKVLVDKEIIAEDMPHDEAFELARKRILASIATVPPGSSKQWIINMTDTVDDDSVLTLRYNLSRHARDRNPVTGEWIIGTDRFPTAFTNRIDNYLFGNHTLTLPRGMMKDADKMIVRFVNSDRDASNVAVFDMHEDLELFIQKGGFGGNYFRALIILFCNIAILAALGLAVSSLFTFPVASFSVISLLIISLLAHYFHSAYGTETGHHHGHECPVEHQSSVTTLIEKTILKAHVVIAPVMKYQPIDSLTDGVRISWKEVAGALSVLMLLYPAILGFAAGYLLNRRELAL